MLSVEFWKTSRIDRKSCWSWHASKINLIHLPLYLLQSPSEISFDSFCTWSWRSIPNKSWNSFFTSNSESRLTKCGNSSCSVEKSWYSQSTFVKIILYSCTKVGIDGDIFLNVSIMEQNLTVSLRLVSW